MNDTYRKYVVYDERGQRAAVIAHAFGIRDGGALVFTKTRVNGGFEAVTAFAAGYWSRVEFVEAVEAVG